MVEIISWSISMKVWDRAGIKLMTPGSAINLLPIAWKCTKVTKILSEINQLWDNLDKLYLTSS